MTRQHQTYLSDQREETYLYLKAIERTIGKQKVMRKFPDFVLFFFVYVFFKSMFVLIPTNKHRRGVKPFFVSL